MSNSELEPASASRPFARPRIHSPSTFLTGARSRCRWRGIRGYWHASEDERNNFRIIGAGYVINWPDVDEHLSSQGILAGAPAPAVMTSSHSG